MAAGSDRMSCSTKLEVAGAVTKLKANSAATAEQNTSVTDTGTVPRISNATGTTIEVTSKTME
jgi:hypothetical protein